MSCSLKEICISANNTPKSRKIHTEEREEDGAEEDIEGKDGREDGGREETEEERKMEEKS